ncbi:MAG: hypothetical protein Kow0069_02300 [Promethearchaeota archaeon]
MPEINLDDLEAWYGDFLSRKYGKLRKRARKVLEQIVRLMYDMQNAISRLEEKQDGISSELARKAAARFCQKMREQFEQLRVPEEVTYQVLRDLVEEIKKLFQNLNLIAKQNVRKMSGEDIKEELKEIDFLTRKLSGEHVKLDKFIRTKYVEAREAEGLLLTLQKLYQTIDKITRLKQKLDELEKQAAELEERLKAKEEELLSMEAHPQIQELAALEKSIFQKRLKFRDLLKFRKVLNKVKTGLEKRSFSIRDVTTATLREYLKDPVATILAQGPSHPQLTAMLVQIRYAIENNILPLKKATRDKVLENIAEIVGDKRLLKEPVEEILGLERKKERVAAEISKLGLLKDRDDVKEEIAQMTVTLEHLKNDADVVRNQFHQALEKLKEQREVLQEELQNQTGEQVKVQITFQF